MQPYLDDVLRYDLFSAEKIEDLSQAMVRDFLAFPKSIKRFFDKLASGRSKVDVSVSEIHELHKSVDRASQRLLLGVLTAGIIIGISIVSLNTDSLFQSWQGWLIILGLASLLIMIMRSMKKDDDQ